MQPESFLGFFLGREDLCTTYKKKYCYKHVKALEYNLVLSINL